MVTLPLGGLLSSVGGLFTVNNGLRLSSLLLLFPQRLRGFEFVHLRKTQQQRRRETFGYAAADGALEEQGLRRRVCKN